MNLSEAISPHPRFSRSINVESDTSASAVQTYLPTGRAIDVVRRVTRSLEGKAAGRAFSITGPHGSGKSSLAVFLSALLSPAKSDQRQTAHELLDSIEPHAALRLTSALEHLDAVESGFILAVATAEREPIIATVARALALGATRHLGRGRANPVPQDWIDPGIASKLTPRDIKARLDALTSKAPVLLLIDEFGKNLEAYADSGRDGDPYLLQELAEWANADEDARLVIITMQHLAFDEYVQESSTARRREWVKVQGRFEDIAYIETSRQSQTLIASAFTHEHASLGSAVRDWSERASDEFRAVGLRELLENALDAYPLDPLALGVLPELCSRYGQNERTLFSFLAGPEPTAVPSILEELEWQPGASIPFVRLPQVYDYFTTSAATMIGSAATGSRWIEIESRIRDTVGLSQLQLAALKSIGVLNLVSAGGTLRASREVLQLGLEGNDAEVLEALDALETRGLVTYRDFADEYRIWQGSDFDLRGAVEAARRQCEARRLEDLLNEAAPQQPLIAARHSQTCGTLRVFERRFSGLRSPDLEPLGPESQWDGTVLLSVSEDLPEVNLPENSKPVVVVTPGNVETLREAAFDAAALSEALRSAEAGEADWVARRELVERLSDAQQRLRRLVSDVFEEPEVKWHLLGTTHVFNAQRGPTRVLSEIADLAYPFTPRVANEMLARKELTSQGAKARRLLIEAMLERSHEDKLGIEGFPAERAMYEAVLAVPGIHGVEKDGTARFSPPKRGTSFARAWQAIEKEFRRAIDERINILEVWRMLQAPPFGLKDGPIPVLLISALIQHEDEIALYEHGTLLLALDDAVAERFARNPGHFTIKNTASESAARRAVISKIADRLEIASYSGAPTFLGVARRLYGRMRSLEPYAWATTRVDPGTDAMRRAFKTAAEPDQLIFNDLPKVFGLEPIPAGRIPKSRHLDDFVSALGAAMDELDRAYPDLLRSIQMELARALAEPPDQFRRSFSVHAAPLVDAVLEPRLKALVLAACQDERDEQEWLENLAMIVADAAAPRSWTDETFERFRLSATELGGAFRRVSALVTEQKAIQSHTVDVVPVAVTRMDGHEERMVLWVSQEEMEAATDDVGTILQEASKKFGSVERARQVILASLLSNRAETKSEDDRAKESIERRRGRG